MDSELPAGLYIRPAGNPATDQHPTIVARTLRLHRQTCRVQTVQRLRAYEISYQACPPPLGSLDIANTPITIAPPIFLSGRPTDSVLNELRGANAVHRQRTFCL